MALLLPPLSRRLRLFILLLPGLVEAFGARAQVVRRIEDFNAIGWYVYQGDHKLGSRFELHTEYQARRTHLITDWQESVLRGGLGFKVMPRLKVGVGYAFVETHPYGKHPRAALGTYPEHRFYEEVSLEDQVGYVRLNQRLRLEQRYVGIAGASGPLADDAVWNRQNRIRYQLMLILPLQGPTLDDNEWYAVGADEVFVNFGRNISANVFDQNRIALGLGRRFSEDFRIELQYLNQILQQAELNPGSKLPVFEFNNGFRLGIIYNLTLIEGTPRPVNGPPEE